MPTNQRISEMTSAATLNGTDIIEIAQVNAGSTSGYASAKTTLTAIANKVNTEIQYGGLNTTAKTIVGAINEAAQSGGGGDAANHNIADEFDSTSTYAVGDYVIYDGDLYKCTSAITTAGAWDSTKWAQTIIVDEMGSGGGGNADVVHLTQAEYDALPSSKLSDDKIYMIEDVTPKEIEGEHYSTNEQIVGTWIDGSPVYQKTYVAAIDTQYGSEPAYDLGTLPSGFDVLISAEGSVRTQNGDGYVTFAGIDNINGWSFGLHITSGHLMLYGGNGNIYQMSAIANGTAVVTIKYTKSAS